MHDRQLTVAEARTISGFGAEVPERACVDGARPRPRALVLDRDADRGSFDRSVAPIEELELELLGARAAHEPCPQLSFDGR
ncbi:MAG: hypothetical protein IPN34_03720 [Planctomycetes bacterium]|nr:hypothetical protein [Planctomycetota bacterium]